jgi:iron complex outermembrane receptor protein
LTASQLATDPRQADPSSIANRARKAVHQGQFGLVASRPLAGGDLTATAYGGWRSLYNPLAQAVVDVDRASGGASVRGTAPLRLLGVTHLLTAGADAQWQNDDRKNFANCNAVATPNASCPRARTDSGVVRLDQRETIASIGPFVRDEIAFGGRYRATVGVRADQIRFRVADRLIVPPTNPDDSGERTLSAVSPVVGVVARLGLLHAAYANISSSFETPTTTELANKENGSAGINPSLQPQYARTYETGLKGFVLARVQYDVAAFLTPVRNELVLFQVPGGNGRTYYRNAGRTRREGAEAALSSAAGPIELGASYSFSRFRFTDYRVTTTTGTGATATTTTTSYAGRAIPGIPRHQLQGSITWRAHRAFATAEGIAYGFVYVNDANSAGAKRYQLLNARAGGTALFGRPWLSPIVGIQNLLDRRYAASVAVNAIGGKYYEPGTGRTVYAGLSAGIGR